MSVKVSTFQSIITNPLNTHNFVCKIPGFDYDMLVESTTFPTETLREVVLWFQGEQIRYPTIPENSGVWNVKVPENDDGKVRNAFKSMKASIYDQKLGILIPPTSWFDAEVFARDLSNNKVFSVILHGCWIRGRGDVPLANNNPTDSWKWDFQFVYQWIEDK